MLTSLGACSSKPIEWRINPPRVVSFRALAAGVWILVLAGAIVLLHYDHRFGNLVMAGIFVFSSGFPLRSYIVQVKRARRVRVDELSRHGVFIGPNSVARALPILGIPEGDD